jgi:hypothetical protein
MKLPPIDDTDIVIFLLGLGLGYLAIQYYSAKSYAAAPAGGAVPVGMYVIR